MTYKMASSNNKNKTLIKRLVNRINNKLFNNPILIKLIQIIHLIKLKQS